MCNLCGERSLEDRSLVVNTNVLKKNTRTIGQRTFRSIVSYASLESGQFLTDILFFPATLALNPLSDRRCRIVNVIFYYEIEIKYDSHP